MKYLLNEVKGKEQGEMFEYSGNTIGEVISKIGKNFIIDEKIKYYDKFSKNYFGGSTYELAEQGEINPIYILYLRNKKEGANHA